MSDLSKLFYGSVGQRTFLNALATTPEQQQYLERIQETIKERLKKGIEEFSASKTGGEEKITPRFFLQGSWAYKTVNQPCHKNQQIDYDYGIFLPTTFLETNKPKIACHLYFQLVDNILQNLSNEKGWSLDRSKPTCSRIIINANYHVDVPLYSIPDSEFTKLAKAIESRRLNNTMVIDRVENSFDDWDEFDDKLVYLAMRGGDWKVSDPRKFHFWFRAEISKHGEQLRRLCKYLKAWRDFQWQTGGPPSIFLMICAAITFESTNRDDATLLSALQAIPLLLQKPVNNPTDPNEKMSENIGREIISETILKMQNFAQNLSQALSSSNITEACDLVMTFPH